MSVAYEHLAMVLDGVNLFLSEMQYMAPRIASVTEQVA